MKEKTIFVCKSNSDALLAMIIKNSLCEEKKTINVILVHLRKIEPQNKFVCRQVKFIFRFVLLFDNKKRKKKLKIIYSN